MRTTLTIDDDLVGLLRTRSQELGKPFKELVNQALRKGLAEDEIRATKRRVITRPKPMGLRPRIDPDRLNQLCDELEVEGYLRKAEQP